MELFCLKINYRERDKGWKTLQFTSQIQCSKLADSMTFVDPDLHTECGSGARANKMKKEMYFC
jgi:hypothetical protein